MPTVNLQVFPKNNPMWNNMFVFDHAQEHVILVQAASEVANVSSALANYNLDPMIGATLPNGLWNFNHQQAHDDAAYWLRVEPSLILSDQSLTPYGDHAWWTHVNHNEHMLLNQSAQQILSEL